MGVLATLACEDSSIHSVEIPVVPGVLQEIIPPEGMEGPLEHAIIIGLSGVLTRSGFALGHLPPEAGDMSRASLLWMGCYVRETNEDSYEMIDRVAGFSLPLRGGARTTATWTPIIESAENPFMDGAHRGERAVKLSDHTWGRRSTRLQANGPRNRRAKRLTASGRVSGSLWPIECRMQGGNRGDPSTDLGFS